MSLTEEQIAEIEGRWWHPTSQDVKRLAAEVRRLRELRQKGCDCSDADACRFARERDAARAELARAVELLRLWLAQEEPMTLETQLFLAEVKKR